DLVAVEREVHFFDAVTLRARAEFGFRTGGAAAEQDEVGLGHDRDDAVFFLLPLVDGFDGAFGLADVAAARARGLLAAFCFRTRSPCSPVAGALAACSR